MEKLTFIPADSDEPIDFYVLEQTVISGRTYILLTEDEEGDGEAWILADRSDPDDPEASYEFVEDSLELEAVGKVFSELLDDVSIT